MRNFLKNTWVILVIIIILIINTLGNQELNSNSTINREQNIVNIYSKEKVSMESLREIIIISMSSLITLIILEAVSNSIKE